MAPPSGTFMDPEAWDEYRETGTMSVQPPAAPQETSGSPAASAAPGSWRDTGLGRELLQQKANANAYAAVRTKIAYGIPVTQEDVSVLSPEQQQELAQEKEAQRQRDYVTAPVRVGGTPGQEEAILPTTSSEQVDLPFNLGEQQDAWDQVARSKTQAVTANYDVQRSMLEQQLLQAREQRVQLQSSVAQQEDRLAYIEDAQRNAINEANGIQVAVREKRVDPGRLFRSAQGAFAAFAAVMADTLLGFRGKQQNTIARLIEQDTAAQEAEITKLRGDADNAFRYALQTYGGDIEMARSALNIAKAEAAKNELAASAAAMGLQQLPAQTLAEMADIDAMIAENTAKMGQNARRKAEQSYKYQPYVAPQYGYERAPTYKEMAERQQGVADYNEQVYRTQTGLTPRESAALEAKKTTVANAERAREDKLKKIGDDRRAELGKELSKIVAVEAAADKWISATGASWNPQTGMIENTSGNLRGYWQGTVGGLVASTVGVQRYGYPEVFQATRNLNDAFLRLRSGKNINEKERANLQEIVRGPQGSEEQALFGANLARAEAEAKRKTLEAAYGHEAVQAMEEELRKNMSNRPGPLTAEPVE